jgi:hypothetical protein
VILILIFELQHNTLISEIFFFCINIENEKINKKFVDDFVCVCVNFVLVVNIFLALS